MAPGMRSSDGQAVNHELNTGNGSLPPLAQTPLSALPAAPPRRIVFFAKRHRYTKATRQYIRAFKQNGYQVFWFHWAKIRGLLGSRIGLAYIRRKLNRISPDMVLVYKLDAPSSILQDTPGEVPLVIFYEDLFAECDPEVLDAVRRCSTVFTTARGDVPAFRDAGVKDARYIRTGCDDKEHYPVAASPRFAGDVAFIGRGWLQNRRELISSRIDLIRAIAEEFDIQLYGKGWEQALGRQPGKREVYVRHYRSICSSSKIVLGIDKSDDIDLYFSNRTWLTLGCGGFLLTRYVPNLEEYFTNHRHLVWFHSKEECLELIDHYLPREDERQAIAEAGHDYVHTYHTTRHFASELGNAVLGESR